MKFLKILLKCALALTLIIILVWLAVLGTLHTRQGQEWALKQTVHYLERQTQTRIQADDIDFIFPFGLRVQGISITQENEKLLTVDSLDFACAYGQLLEGKLVCSSLHAKGVELLKIPAGTDLEGSPSSKIPLENLNSALVPFYIKFENISIKDIKLSPLAAEQLNISAPYSSWAAHTLFSLKGSITNNPFKNTLSSQFFIKATDTTDRSPPFLLSLDLHDRQLAVSIHYNHLSYQLDAGGEQPLAVDTTLALFASAPLLIWQEAAENRMDPESAIEGQFKVIANLEDTSSSLSSFLGQEVTLKGKYAWKPGNVLHLWNTHLKSLGLTLKGEAVLASDRIIQQGSFEGELKDAAHLSPWLKKSMQGMVKIEGNVTGSLSETLVVIHGISRELVIENQAFQNVRSTISTVLKDGRPEGFLNLAFDHQESPCHLAAEFKWSPELLGIPHFELNALRSKIQGKLNFSPADFILEGDIIASSGNLNEFSSFISQPLYGEGELSVHLMPILDEQSIRRQGIECDLSGYALRWKNFYAERLSAHITMDPLDEQTKIFRLLSQIKGQNVRWEDKRAASLSLTATHQADLINLTLSDIAAQLSAQEIKWLQGKAEQASVDMYFADPLKDLQGKIKFYLQKVMTPALALDYVQGETAMNPAEEYWPFTLQSQGTWKDKWAINTDGLWHMGKEATKLRLNHLDGSFGPHPLQLLKPLTFVHQPEKIEISDLHARWGEAELAAELHYERQTIAFHFNTNEIPTNLLQAVAADLPLTGKTSFSGYLEGPLQQPTGELKVKLHHIQITEDIFASKPFIEGEIDLTIQESGIELQSTLHGIGRSPVLAHGTLPFTVSLSPLELKVSQITPFSVNLEAEGEIEPYMHLLYNDSANLTGQAKVALNFSGQVNAPRIQGTIDLYNGFYESLSTGSSYHNIQAHLEGDGSKIILKNFSAENNKNGSITAVGSLELDKNKDFPFDFQIRPRHIFIMESDYANISASGPLRLIGTRKKAKLQGDLTVDSAVIHMEEALPKQVKSVDVKYINLPEGERLPSHLAAAKTTSPIEFDVKLHLPGKVLIEGKNLSSEWKGEIAITGTPSDPLMNGDLRVTQGEYSFNGKVFNLSQGNIRFAGSPSKKTSIYVVASKEIDRIRAEIIVKGPTNKLVVSFRSNPPLSQREILSYILFNRGIADITPDQGDQLSQSFISLNESEQTSSSDDFLTRIRNNIGIDRLDITSNDSANKDLALQVGKYITEGIFVSINKSISDIGNRVAVEANIHKNLKAQAEVELGSGTQGKVSLKWKKDY